MIGLIIIAIAGLFISHFFSDEINTVFSLLSVLIGLIVATLLFGSSFEKSAENLKTERTEILTEYSTYTDKSETLKKIEEYNSDCSEAKKNAENIWLNPLALFKEYDNFDKLKIDIDNLAD